MKIFVLFVEPMLYGMDLIHEVYEKTKYQYRYVYCTRKLTGKDNPELPENSFVCTGNKREHRAQVIYELKTYQPDFAIINGYVGIEQTAAIRYCQMHSIPYAIESDTPLHVPENKMKAIIKRIYLKRLLHHKCCYGFPGGTLQKENLVYYGIPEDKNYIMPMSVSRERLLGAAEGYPSKDVLKAEMGIEWKTVFLFVGRLAPEKNVGLLINAFRTLHAHYPETALLIVGDGPERSSLKQMAHDMDSVHFAGYVVFPELVKYYKMSDILVLPSEHEPWGLVVNEAMTFGLPVIVSDKVGCRVDLISSSNNGMIFKYDNEQDLYEKMVCMFGRNYQDYSGYAGNMISQWNYNFYLKSFFDAVGRINKL